MVLLARFEKYIYIYQFFIVIIINMHITHSIWRRHFFLFGRNVYMRVFYTYLWFNHGKPYKLETLAPPTFWRIWLTFPASIYSFTKALIPLNFSCLASETNWNMIDSEVVMVAPADRIRYNNTKREEKVLVN